MKPQHETNSHHLQRGRLINLGCGNRIHPKWTNLDLHSNLPNVEEHDLSQGIPVKDNVAEAVYTAAMLEHLPAVAVRRTLGECYRVLQPGGILRVAVPDFEGQAREYLHALAREESGEDQARLDKEWMLLEMIDQLVRDQPGGRMGHLLREGSLTNRDFIVSRIGNEGRELMRSAPSSSASRKVTDFPSLPDPVKPRWGFLGRLLTGFLFRSKDVDEDLRALAAGRFRLFSGEIHQWVYDHASLRFLLEESGFSQPRKRDHGESLIPDWKEYHLEIDESGNIHKPDLLVMEATKPTETTETLDVLE